MYKGIIEAESLNDLKILDELEVVRRYEEHHPEEEPPLWHGYNVKVAENELKKVIKQLSQDLMEEGWFALIWNDTQVYVIFKDDVLELTNNVPWNSQEFQKLIDYGKAQGIQRKWFDNMRNPMNQWGKSAGE